MEDTRVAGAVLYATLGEVDTYRSEEGVMGVFGCMPIPICWEGLRCGTLFRFGISDVRLLFSSCDSL